MEKINIEKQLRNQEKNLKLGKYARENLIWEKLV